MHVVQRSATVSIMPGVQAPAFSVHYHGAAPTVEQLPLGVAAGGATAATESASATPPVQPAVTRTIIGLPWQLEADAGAKRCVVTPHGALHIRLRTVAAART